MKQRLVLAWLLALTMAAALLALPRHAHVAAPPASEPVHYGAGRVPPPITINAIDFGAVHDGVTDDSAAILAAAQVASDGGAQSITEHFHPGVYFVGQNLSLPTNIILQFDQGAELRPGSGVLIALTTKIDALGAQQIFDYSAGGTVQWPALNGSTVDWAGTPAVSPCWWGADPTGTNDSAPAFNEAISAVNPIPLSTSVDVSIGTLIVIPPGKYKLLSSIHMWRSVTLQGAGGQYHHSTVLSPAAGVTALVADRAGTYGVAVGNDAGATFVNASQSAVRNLAVVAAAKTVYTAWAPAHAYAQGAVVVPQYGAQWAANTSYPLGTYITPLKNFNGLYAVLTTTTGNSGAAEPAWSRVPGATVTDGSNTWTEVGGWIPGMYAVALNAGTSATTGNQPLWPNGPVDGLNNTTVTDNPGASQIVWAMHEQGSGIRMYSNLHVEDCYVGSMESDGIRIFADGSTTPPTIADDWQITNTVLQSNSGSGVFTAGGDSSAGTMVGGHSSSNGHFGLYDKSFLGNVWIGVDTEANALGAYVSVDPNAASVFLGVYTEANQPQAHVMTPAMTFGGQNAAGFANQQTGERYNANGITPFNLLSNVSAAPTGVSTGYNISIGELSQPTVFFYGLATDPTPTRFIYEPTLGGQPWPQWDFLAWNTTIYTGMGFNAMAHREGVANVTFVRGLSVGPTITTYSIDSGPRITSGAAAPSGPLGFFDDFYRVGDVQLNSNPNANGIARWLSNGRFAFENVDGGVNDWQMGTSYQGGNLIVPTDQPWKVMRAIAVGTTGGSRPTWPAAIGQTVIDGTQTWEYFGDANPNLVVDGGLDASYQGFTPEMANPGALTHNMTSDANYTLGVHELLYAAGSIFVTDTGAVLSTQRSIVLPLFAGARGTFRNETLQTLQFMGGSGTGFTLPSGKSCWGNSDGVNWYQVTAPNFLIPLQDEAWMDAGPANDAAALPVAK